MSQDNLIGDQRATSPDHLQVKNLGLPYERSNRDSNRKQLRI